MPSIHACKPLTDDHENIDKLVKEAPHTDGAPNFRRLPGFPIFGTGQTTLDGFNNCLEPILKKYGDEKNIFWVILRQEPVVYVNDKPFTARDHENLTSHLVVSNPDDVAKMEDVFSEELKSRGPELKFYRDPYGEHPEEKAAKMEEQKEKIQSISTLTTIFGDLKKKVDKVEAIRIPINLELAPTAECFDQLVGMLKDTTASTPIVFNCQAGVSRTTTGMVVAALIKEFQLASELEQMKGIVPDDILEALKKKKLGLPGIDTEAPPERNALIMGEFEVILELIAARPEAKIAKAQVDKLIDIASQPPRGTGVINLREIIIENKMTFDVSSDDWQVYLKGKIMDNIERYFYLILFALYVREVGPKDFPQTFGQWLEERQELKTMIQEGRGKLEWERKIPDEKLGALKDMLAGDDFKAKLPKVIKRIYELAWEQFSDLPRGHHKNNSMHKLASKTMIEILPEKLTRFVEAKCGNVANTPDFFDVIGQVSWYTEGEELPLPPPPKKEKEDEEPAPEETKEEEVKEEAAAAPEE